MFLPSYHEQVYRVVASMEVFVRPWMCMKFSVKVLADGLLLINEYLFVFGTLYMDKVMQVMV